VTLTGCRELFIIAAGDPAAVGACQPLLGAMGQKTISIGTEPAAANLAKLSGNFLLGSPSRLWAKRLRSL
jgi:3-hydroxyisobutyrate dehydrogenase-like beta-hydroxyacid dehydrogenase